MIIYGSKNKELAKEIVTDKCENCGKQNSIDLHLFQKYAHVFWIPFFPTGKTGVSQCDHCKQVLKLKEMPASIRLNYDNLKAQTKTPIWMYSGLGVVFFFITVIIFSGIENDKKNKQLILTPQHGDIFEIKTKDNQYTLYKIAEVQSDSVFVRVNNYETNKATGLGELKSKGEETYSDGVFGFSKAELKVMLNKGEIINIIRR